MVAENHGGVETLLLLLLCFAIIFAVCTLNIQHFTIVKEIIRLLCSELDSY